MTSSPSRPTGLRGALALLTATVAVATSSTAVARPPTHVRTATPPPVTALDCEEHEAWVDGNSATVARALPKGYTALTDGNGAPLVFARAERCGSFTAGGHTQPVVVADYGIVVNTPDRTGCASGVPTASDYEADVPPICNWYTLRLVTNDRQLVSWLRQGTPTIPASYDKHLTYRDGSADASGRKPFHFSGAGFTIDDVSSFNPGTLSLRGGYWFRTPQGTVKMIVSTDDLTSGPADTTLHAPSGSPLSRLMGATTRTSPQPYAQFGIIHASHGVLRKQLFGPRLRGEAPLHSFDGSCSVQGDVTFNPPATNTQTPTSYAYDATGTCNGKLDGTTLSATPIHLRQSGHSDASCIEALAFPPGTGTMTFPSGVEFRYTLDFESETIELDGTAYGTRSGRATGRASFLTQRSSPTIVTDCSTTGAKRAPMDMSFSTRGGPMISS